MNSASHYPNAAAALGSYQQVGVQTATPQQLVLMLFDGLEKQLGLASASHATEGAGETALKKALDILGELEASLDLDRGGEMAANLFALYDYVSRMLRTATAGDASVAQARGLISPVADAWRTICAREQGLATAAVEA